LIAVLAGIKAVEFFGEEGEEHVGKYSLEQAKELLKSKKKSDQK
jgi:hypothetical protein